MKISGTGWSALTGYALPLIPAILILMGGPFRLESALTPLPFLALVPVFIAAGWDPRILLGYTLAEWLLAGTALILGSDLAEALASMGYWHILAAALVLLGAALLGTGQGAPKARKRFHGIRKPLA